MSTQVLITGAAGFVGGHLAKHLRAQGQQVRALVRSGSGTERLDVLDVDIVRGDVRDAQAVERAVQACDHVYHLAAYTSRRRASRRELNSVNVGGTEVMAEAARKVGVARFVLASSLGIYGVPRMQPADEATPPAPGTSYQVSKLRAEEVARRSADQGLPLVIARLPSIVGPWTVNWLGWTRDIAARRFRPIGPSTARLQPAAVADVVDGLQRCAETPGIDGSCYVLAGASPVTVDDLAGMIATALDVRLRDDALPAWPFEVYLHLATVVHGITGLDLPRAHSGCFFLRDRVFSTARAARELDFHPQTPLADEVHRMIRWYEEAGLLA